MKRKILLILLSITLIFSGIFGCVGSTKETVSVVSIELTSTEGLTDTYTITYSDGTTSTLEISNGADGLAGADGKDGTDLTVTDLFNKYKEQYPSATYADFLSLFSINAEGSVNIINEALLSSAKVYCEFTQSNRGSKETAVYLGSAVLYEKNSDYTYFITNYHVIYNKNALETGKTAKKIVCYLYGSEGNPTATENKDANGCTVYEYGDYAIECELVGGSVTADIAVIRARTSDVLAINDGVKEIEFASGYKVGETAIAIGNPEGEGISVTEGIVSVDNEYIALSVDGTTRSYRVVRIDTAIYNGSSGGGLFDGEGKLIGITNAGDGEDQNVNYAVPVQIVRGVVENIMHYSPSGEKNAKKVKLGIEVTKGDAKFVYSEQDGYGKIVESITISNVEEGLIGEGMGLALGDEIKSIIVNGVEKKLNRIFEVGDILFTVFEGDKINFKVVRGGNEITLTEYTVLSSDITQTE